MSKLNVDQKTILELFSDKKADFLIPDYQRPYAWNEEQCQTLWDDLFSFSFPNDDYEAFDDNEEYFLGCIVSFKNEIGKSEIIDGQQRLTTLLLILRAFYDKFANMKDTNSKLTRDRIEQCLWKTDTFGTADKGTLKIDSEVATDNDKEEFLDLLRTGVIHSDSKSQYVTNYEFFTSKIADFLSNYASYFPYLPARILGNCILLPIEAESQDTALRIFSTLNDRGLPLSDADIFKAQFYKYYGDLGKKDEFIEDWKQLEEISSEVFQSSTGSSMDELFARYMYFLRAKEGNKRTTTEALRKFYEKDKYKYLKNEETLSDLAALAGFWESVGNQDSDRFSEVALKKLFVLHYAPNSMWQNIASVYFLHNRIGHDDLSDSEFCSFLDKITGFIYAYAVTNPGVNALRTPIYDEMVNIVNGETVSFAKYVFDKDSAMASFNNYSFTNQRNITRALVTWHVFSNSEQQLLKVTDDFHIEHIYSRKRQQIESGLSKQSLVESLGNKVLLESKINIRASDYRFEDKKAIYSGSQRRGKYKEASKVYEVQKLATFEKFDEAQLVEREKKMLHTFFRFLEQQKLV